MNQTTPNNAPASRTSASDDPASSNAQPVPKQDRAIRTRRLIIEAAIVCAGRTGVASSSTAKVAAEAGVSQGALFRYFPQRAQLWGAALEQLLAELFNDAVVSLLGAAEAEDPIKSAIAGLWRVFTDDRLFVAFELFAEARTNHALRAELAPVVTAHTEREVALAAAILPNAGDALEPTVLGILSTLQGAAVSSRTLMREGADPVELLFIEAVVRNTLGDLELGALADTLRASRNTSDGVAP